MEASRTVVRIRRLDLTFLAVAGLILLTGLIWLLGPGAGWVLEHVDDVTVLSGKERAEALDAIRGRGLTLSTGVVALVAVFYTARNADTARRTYEVGQRTLALSEQGLVTDRYTKAIEQLGSAELAVRLGGIYALERIARDSARDQPAVMEVLTAFVRQPSYLAQANASDRDRHGRTAKAAPLEGRPRLRADVQAAVAVIGRRNVSHDDPDRGRIDLAEAHLAGADLAGARLGQVDLAQADLTDADLTGADLSRANLWRANLTRARLTQSDLVGAILDGARFTDAVTTGANFEGAGLDGVLGLSDGAGERRKSS